jgi:hypothetical protein
LATRAPESLRTSHTKFASNAVPKPLKVTVPAGRSSPSCGDVTQVWAWTADTGARCIASPSRITPHTSTAAPSTVIFTVLAGVPAFSAAAVAV